MGEPQASVTSNGQQVRAVHLKWGTAGGVGEVPGDHIRVHTMGQLVNTSWTLDPESRVGEQDPLCPALTSDEIF